jgi:hypothetical protein
MIKRKLKDLFFKSTIWLMFAGLLIKGLSLGETIVFFESLFQVKIFSHVFTSVVWYNFYDYSPIYFMVWFVLLILAYKKMPSVNWLLNLLKPKEDKN